MPTIPPYFQVEQTPATTSTPLEPTPASTTAPPRTPDFPCPKLRLHLQDTAHPGSSIFLSHTNGHTDLSTQVQNVLKLLYHHPESTNTTTTAPSLPSGLPRPGTRSVTFILRPFDGVAYTTGTDLDDDHKEIHLNTAYIAGVAKRKNHVASEIRHEILGVLCHELVHCFQWSAEGTCPGGLIEGIADWVRLKAGLGATHWKQEADGEWDGGYQHTGYFLDYLEQRFGEGTVRHMNACLARNKYNEKKLFGDCCKGRRVKQLWEDYGKHLKKTLTATSSAVCEAPTPTHGPLPDRPA